MVSCVGAADSGGVDTSLTGSLEAVCADSNAGSDCVYFEPIEGLEVKPDGNDENEENDALNALDSYLENSILSQFFLEDDTLELEL